MADLGNVGKSVSALKPRIAKSVYGDNNRMTGNVATGSGATSGAMIVLVLGRGQVVDETHADGSGGWSFYDLDNGTYYANEVGSTKAWEVSIVAGTPTVTPFSAGGGTVAFGWVG